MKTIQRPSPIGLICSAFLLSSILYSCIKENVDPVTISQGEYFPLEDGTSCEYLHQHYSFIDSTLQGSSLKISKVLGDTTIFGKTYKKIVSENGYLEKLIRKDSSRYYGMNHELYGGFSTEYMFLDT